MLRQVFAEISGKNAGKSDRLGVGEKDYIEAQIPEGARFEVFSLVKAVELVSSPEVRSKAAEELREKVREIANGELNEETLLKAGLYAVAAELMALEKEEKLKKLLDTG